MNSLYSPPETYQQWLTGFAHLQQHPLDHEMLDALACGRYIGRPAEAFLVRLSDVVGAVITAHCKRFLRQIDMAFSDEEPDMVPLLASRLKRNLSKCFFYRNLSFLDPAYVKTLDDGFCEQLEFFWKDVLTELRRSARDSMDSRMEDVCFEMKRIKIFQREVRK